ncbi:MAG: hypothetical protein H6621_10820 [Halobacteriovoraceae bacterium]|nr:hypothetical protein [Halobacteriovoraceae bacterium]MCB9095550.1 hypothetical protein [Halobacteriovoraceae bacterium]
MVKLFLAISFVLTTQNFAFSACDYKVKIGLIKEEVKDWWVEYSSKPSGETKQDVEGPSAELLPDEVQVTHLNRAKTKFIALLPFELETGDKVFASKKFRVNKSCRLKTKLNRDGETFDGFQ